MPQNDGSLGNNQQARTSGSGPAPDENALIDTEIAELKATLRRTVVVKQLVPYLGLAAFVSVCVLASLSGLGAPASLAPSDITNWFLEISRSPELTALLGGTLLILIGLITRAEVRRNALDAQVELLEAKKRIAARLPDKQEKENDNPVSYFDSLVKINVDNLAEYYSLVKVHTNNSFRASLLAGFVGFGFILIGVIAGFGGAQTATPATISAISGVLIEFISGVFFYLYNRTVRQLKEYHDSLISVQNVLLSLKLVTDTEDAVAKREMTGLMCEYLLAGINVPTGPKTTTAPKGRGGRRTKADGAETSA